jgi:hypothetical protein
MNIQIFDVKVATSNKDESKLECNQASASRSCLSGVAGHRYCTISIFSLMFRLTSTLAILVIFSVFTPTELLVCTRLAEGDLVMTVW